MTKISLFIDFGVKQDSVLSCQFSNTVSSFEVLDFYPLPQFPHSPLV